MQAPRPTPPQAQRQGQQQADHTKPASSGTAPVINPNFAHPDILLTGGLYHAYATNAGGQNIQHEASRDLKYWMKRPDALATLGAWTGPCSFTPGGSPDHYVWALPHQPAGEADPQ